MIRYYKGIQKVRRLTKRSPLGTVLYEILESGELGKAGTKTVFPTRKGFKKRKLVEITSIRNPIITLILGHEY